MLSYISHSIDFCTLAIKNIKNIHTVSNNEIADSLQFNNFSYLRVYPLP